jgi:hypothetical protein
MIVAVSALDVALISAIAATIGAVVSPISARLVANAAHKQERWMRLYEDRRDAYLAVLASAYDARQAMRELIRLFEENDPEISLPSLPDHAERAKTFAKIQAFAKPCIRDAVEKFHDDATAMGDALDGLDLKTPEGYAEAAKRLRAINEPMGERVERIRQLIHEELTS